MKRFAVILALVALAGSARALSVVVSNDLSVMDRSGWHTNAPYIAWPASNHISFAFATNGHVLKATPVITTNVSGGATNIVTNMVDKITATNNTTAFYCASNLFIVQTNFVFTNNGVVVTQPFDAVFSAAGNPHGGVAYPYAVDYKFLSMATNAGGTNVEVITTKTLTLTNAPALTNALFNARQLRIWDVYQAIYERAHVRGMRYRSTLDQVAGSNYPTRADISAPWVTFYRRPWEAILNEQSALIFEQWADQWLDPAYMTNLLARINALTNGVGISIARYYFPIGGASIDPSNAFDMATAYNIPTNYATWVPANMSWVENIQRKHIETNTFMTWTTNGEVISTAIWTNAPIAAGRVSTDYGLDTLRPLISATRYSVTDARFAVTVWNHGLGVSTNSYAEAAANALAAPTDEMAGLGATRLSSLDAGWTARVFMDGSDYKAYYAEKVGRLYCGALPETVTHESGDYMGPDGVPPSDALAKSGDVYAYTRGDFEVWTITPQQVLLESFAAQTNAVMSGGIYGRTVNAGDFPSSAGSSGEVYQVTFGVLDYGVTNGFIYQ